MSEKTSENEVTKGHLHMASDSRTTEYPYKCDRLCQSLREVCHTRKHPAHIHAYGIQGIWAMHSQPVRNLWGLIYYNWFLCTDMKARLLLTGLITVSDCSNITTHFYPRDFCLLDWSIGSCVLIWKPACCSLDYRDYLIHTTSHASWITWV